MGAARRRWRSAPFLRMPRHDAKLQEITRNTRDSGGTGLVSPPRLTTMCPFGAARTALSRSVTSIRTAEAGRRGRRSLVRRSGSCSLPRAAGPPVSAASGPTAGHRPHRSQRRTPGETVKLTFRGTSSSSGSCPSVYETDRGTLIIQGWRVTDAEAIAALTARGLPAHETAVEIPVELLVYLPSQSNHRSQGSPQ